LTIDKQIWKIKVEEEKEEKKHAKIKTYFYYSMEIFVDTV